MKKLRLNLDQLAVESFDTATPRNLRGTVRGNDDYISMVACVTDEDITCGSCPNAGGTCDQCGTGYTCGASCGGSCYCSGDTCAATCPLPETCAQNAC